MLLHAKQRHFFQEYLNKKNSITCKDNSFLTSSLISYTQNSFILYFPSYFLSHYIQKLKFFTSLTFSLNFLKFDDFRLLTTKYLSFSISISCEWFKKLNMDSINLGNYSLDFQIFHICFAKETSSEVFWSIICLNLPIELFNNFRMRYTN